MKKKTVPKVYKETKEARKERVRNEGSAYRPRIEQPKTNYNRKRAKNEVREMTKEE